MECKISLKYNEEPVAYGNRIIVRLDNEVGRIFVPSTAQITSDTGTVYGYGHQVNESDLPFAFRIGERVSFKLYGGELFKRELCEDNQSREYEYFFVINTCDLVLGRSDRFKVISPEEEL
jgi:co-chaperonin GroES (HSP10)